MYFFPLWLPARYLFIFWSQQFEYNASSYYFFKFSWDSQLFATVVLCFIIFGKFSTTLSSNISSLILTLFSFWDSNCTLIRPYDIVSQISCFSFPQIFFFFFLNFGLDNICQLYSFFPWLCQMWCVFRRHSFVIFFLFTISFWLLVSVCAEFPCLFIPHISYCRVTCYSWWFYIITIITNSFSWLF